MNSPRLPAVSETKTDVSVSTDNHESDEVIEKKEESPPPITSLNGSPVPVRNRRRRRRLNIALFPNAGGRNLPIPDTPRTGFGIAAIQRQLELGLDVQHELEAAVSHLNSEDSTQQSDNNVEDTLEEPRQSPDS